MAPEKFTFTLADGRIVQVEISKDDRGTYRWALKDDFTTTTSAGYPSVTDALRCAEQSAAERYKERVVHVMSNVAWGQTSDGLYRATIYGHSVTVMVRDAGCDIVVSPQGKGSFTGHCRGYEWKKVAENMARALGEP